MRWSSIFILRTWTARGIVVQYDTSVFSVSLAQSVFACALLSVNNIFYGWKITLELVEWDITSWMLTTIYGSSRRTNAGWWQNPVINKTRYLPAIDLLLGSRLCNRLARAIQTKSNSRVITLTLNPCGALST